MERKGKPTQFTRKFAAAWCGVGSEATAYRGIKELLGRGIIQIVGTAPTRSGSEACVYMPGDHRTRQKTKARYQKSSPEPRRATEKRANVKELLRTAADRLRAEYEGIALNPDDVVPALAAYSGIAEIALRRHYADLVGPLVRELAKRGRR